MTGTFKTYICVGEEEWDVQVAWSVNADRSIEYVATTRNGTCDVTAYIDGENDERIRFDIADYAKEQREREAQSLERDRDFNHDLRREARIGA